MAENALDPRCPCCSGKRLSQCCQPYFADVRAVPTAEHLMRARFSAYALGNQGAFLFQTWHPKERAQLDIAALDQVAQRWKRLTVLEHVADGEQAEVAFLAFYDTDQGLEVMHERSRFVYESGQWFYCDGQQFDTAIPARKAACLCGSGKSFKRCCGS